MPLKLFTLCIFIGASTSAFGQTQHDTIRIAEGLAVIPLTPGLYQHISYLQSEDFGQVACNGLIYINGNEAIVCDSPPTDEESKQLLGWMRKTYPNVTVKALIINHHHIDCLGGIREFHKAGVKSYAHELTPSLLKQKRDSSERPQVLVKKSFELPVGNKAITLFYPGEAHTKDNIVTWIPSESTIFEITISLSQNGGAGPRQHRRN
jgi:metallo-beta-lactamase class B